MMKMVKRRHKEEFQVTKPRNQKAGYNWKLPNCKRSLQLGNCLDTRHLTRTALTVAAGTGGALRSSGTPPRHVQKENVCDIRPIRPNFRSKPLSRLSISHLQNFPPLSRLYHLPQLQSFLKVGSIRNLHHSVTKDWSSFQSNSPKISPSCWRIRGTLSRRHPLRSPPPPIHWSRKRSENVNFGSTKTLKNI